STAEVAVNVTAPAPDAPVAIINANPTAGDAPVAVNFDASGSTGQIDTYEWNFGDGNTATGPTASHSYAASGEFVATLRVVGPGGESTAEVAVNVTAPAPDAPVAIINA